jgi:hypothetical protein
MQTRMLLGCSCREEVKPLSFEALASGDAQGCEAAGPADRYTGISSP